MLTKYPEFSEYSNKNLIMLLSSFIGFATHRFKIDKFQLSGGLQNMQDTVKQIKRSSFFKFTEQRKRDIIENFESAYADTELNIEDFV